MRSNPTRALAWLICPGAPCANPVGTLTAGTGWSTIAPNNAKKSPHRRDQARGENQPKRNHCTCAGTDYLQWQDCRFNSWRLLLTV